MPKEARVALAGHEPRNAVDDRVGPARRSRHEVGAENPLPVGLGAVKIQARLRMRLSQDVQKLRPHGTPVVSPALAGKL